VLVHPGDLHTKKEFICEFAKWQILGSSWFWRKESIPPDLFSIAILVHLVYHLHGCHHSALA